MEDSNPTQMAIDLEKYKEANDTLVKLIKKLNHKLIESISRSSSSNIEIQDNIDKTQAIISELVQQREDVINMRNNNVYNENVNNSLQLLVTANYYHYLVFAIAVAITTVLLFRVYLYEESSMIETVILVAGILLILYHLMNVLSKHIHFY